MRALLCALVMSMTASIRAPTSVAAAVPSCAKEKADSLIAYQLWVKEHRAEFSEAELNERRTMFHAELDAKMAACERQDAAHWWVPPPPSEATRPPPPIWQTESAVSPQRQALLRQEAIWDSARNTSKNKDSYGLPSWFSHKTRVGFKDWQGRVWPSEKAKRFASKRQPEHPRHPYADTQPGADSSSEWRSFLPPLEVGGGAFEPSLLQLPAPYNTLLLAWRDVGPHGSSVVLARMPRPAPDLRKVGVKSAGLLSLFSSHKRTAGLWAYPQILAQQEANLLIQPTGRSVSAGYQSHSAVGTPLFWFEARSDTLAFWFSEQPPASAKPEHPESCSPHWWECQQFVRIRHSLDSERAFTRFAEPWGVVARLPWRGATPHAQFLRTRTSGDGYFVTHDRQEEYVPIIEWAVPMSVHPDGESPYSIFAWTQDRGKLWERANMTQPGENLVGPTVVSRLRGDMFALFASLDGTHQTLYSSTSDDEGRSWTPAQPTALPSNGDPVQAAVLRSGRIVVVFSNGVRLSADRVGKRSVPFSAARRRLPNVQHVTHPPLSIALSEDDGDTWRYVRDLDIPTEPHIKLSHPTLAPAPDGSVHIAYSVGQEQASEEDAHDRVFTTTPSGIHYARVTESWIKSGGSVGLFKGGSNLAD